MNITGNETNPPEVVLWLRATVATYLIIVLTVGVPANIIAAIIYGRTSPKTACDWLLLTMSITDAFVCFCSPLLYLKVYLRITLPWRKSILCSLEYWLQLTAMIASCALLVLIALDRYVKICRPYHKSLTPLMARNVCIICVVISAAICSFPFLIRRESSTCYISELRHTDSNRIFFTILFCGFVVSFAFVTFAYASICRQINEKIKLKQRLIEDNGLRPTTKHQNTQETVEQTPGTFLRLYKQTSSAWRERARKKFGFSYNTGQNTNNSRVSRKYLNNKGDINMENKSMGEDTDVITEVGKIREEIDKTKDNGNMGEEVCTIMENKTILEVNDFAVGEDTIVLNLNLHAKLPVNGAKIIGHSNGLQDSSDLLFKRSKTRILQDGEKVDDFINPYHYNMESTSQIKPGLDGVPICQFEESISKHRNLVYEICTEQEAGDNNNVNYVETGAARFLTSAYQADGQDDLVLSCSKTAVPELNPFLMNAEFYLDSSVLNRINLTGHDKDSFSDLQGSVASSSFYDSDFLRCRKFKPLEMGDNEDRFKLQQKSTALSFGHGVIMNGNSVSTSFKKKKPSSKLLLSALHLPSRMLLLHRHNKSEMNKVSSCPNLFLAGSSMLEKPICCSKDREANNNLLKISAKLGDKDIRLNANRHVGSEIETSKYGLNIARTDTPKIRGTPRSVTPFDHSSNYGLEGTNSNISFNQKCSNISSYVLDQYENLVRSDTCLAANQEDARAYNITQNGRSVLFPLEHLRSAAHETSAYCIPNPRKEIFPPKNSKHTQSCFHKDSIHDNAKDSTHGDPAKNGDISSTLGHVDTSHAHHSSENPQRKHTYTTTDATQQEPDPTQGKVKNFETLLLPASRPQSVLKSTGSVTSHGSHKSATFLEVPQRGLPADGDSSADDDDEVFNDMPTTLFFSTCRSQGNKSGCKNSGTSGDSLRSSGIRKRFARERQMTYMLLSVTAAFLLSWIPPWMIYLVMLYGPLNYSSYAVLPHLGIIHLLNYVASPIVYCIFNTTFRSKVKKLLMPSCRRK